MYHGFYLIRHIKLSSNINKQQTIIIRYTIHYRNIIGNIIHYRTNIDKYKIRYLTNIKTTNISNIKYNTVTIIQSNHYRNDKYKYNTINPTLTNNETTNNKLTQQI
jgi:hypothetical protein